MSRGGGGGGGAPKGVNSSAHHELPHDDSKRVHVARAVQLAVVQHLGGDVEGCAALRAARVALLRLVACHAHRHAEVRDLCGRGAEEQRRDDVAVAHVVALHA